jgi:hypothetical protein
VVPGQCGPHSWSRTSIAWFSPQSVAQADHEPSLTPAPPPQEKAPRVWPSRPRRAWPRGTAAAGRHAWRRSRPTRSGAAWTGRSRAGRLAWQPQRFSHERGTSSRGADRGPSPESPPRNGPPDREMGRLVWGSSWIDHSALTAARKPPMDPRDGLTLDTRLGHHCVGPNGMGWVSGERWAARYGPPYSDRGVGHRSGIDHRLRHGIGKVRAVHASTAARLTVIRQPFGVGSYDQRRRALFLRSPDPPAETRPP